MKNIIENSIGLSHGKMKSIKSIPQLPSSKILLILLIFLLMFSCKKDSIDDIPVGFACFDLINPPFMSPNRFAVVYDDTFSGEISYIISQTNLAITNGSEFNASNATKTDIAISADNLEFNNYFNISYLTPGQTYFVYILDKSTGEVKSFSKTTAENLGTTQETGTIDGTIPYYLNFPHGYDPESSTKWPFVLSVKAPNFTESDHNFPCITFSVNINGSGSMQTDINNLRLKVKSIIENTAYKINLDKLYAVGFSAGGCSAMEIANDDGSDQYKFKAVIGIGISSWLGQTTYSNNLGDTDIWLFYGSDDITYGVNGTKVAYQTIPRTSGDHFLTEMPGVGHDANPVWASPYPILWLLSK